MDHYKPCRSDMTTKDLAEKISQEDIQLHAVHSAIISNHSPLFTFWLLANLIYPIQIEQQL